MIQLRNGDQTAIIFDEQKKKANQEPWWEGQSRRPITKDSQAEIFFSWYSPLARRTKKYNSQ